MGWRLGFGQRIEKGHVKFWPAEGAIADTLYVTLVSLWPLIKVLTSYNNDLKVQKSLLIISLFSLFFIELMKHVPFN